MPFTFPQQLCRRKWLTGIDYCPDGSPLTIDYSDLMNTAWYYTNDGTPAGECCITPFDTYSYGTLSTMPIRIEWSGDPLPIATYLWTCKQTSGFFYTERFPYTCNTGPLAWYWSGKILLLGLSSTSSWTTKRAGRQSILSLSIRRRSSRHGASRSTTSLKTQILLLCSFFDSNVSFTDTRSQTMEVCRHKDRTLL